MSQDRGAEGDGGIAAVLYWQQDCGLKRLASLCPGYDDRTDSGGFNFHLQFQMSQGGLVQMWHRVTDILQTWYDEIAEEIQKPGFCTTMKQVGGSTV